MSRTASPIKPVHWKPRKEDLLAAAGKKVPDVIAPGLQVLFCGINPGLYSAWAGHHFARPGNRFWPTLRAAGFTDWLLAPAEERQLLACGYGITNLVNRARRKSELDRSANPLARPYFGYCRIQVA